MKRGVTGRAGTQGADRRQGGGRIGLALLIAFVAGIGQPARASESTVTIYLDRAALMRYPADTETIVVGNPIIADVTMIKNEGQLILTGKGYGSTNLVFLNRSGDVLAEARLLVREMPNTLIVQRGGSRESYECEPRCQPVVSLGDSTTFLNRSISDIQARNAQATGAAASSSAVPH